MTRRRAQLIPLVLWTLLGSAAGQEAEERRYPDGIAAIVEGRPVTRHELELACRLRADFRNMPDGEQRRSILASELEEIIRQRVLLERVEKEGIDFTKSDEARLQWELERRARDRRGLEGLKEDLDAVGVPYDYFVERQKANILVGKLLVKTISRDIFVTPAEIRAYYDQHPERFQRPGELRLRQIVLFADPQDAYRSQPPGLQGQAREGWDPRAAAEALRARVLGGEDFRALAAECSMGVHYDEDEVYESSVRLSDVLVPPLDRLAAELEVGKVSQVLRSERGSYHLLLVLGRQVPGPLPLEEVQREIEAELKEATWRQRLDAWVEEVRAQAHVEVFLSHGPP